ncbi:MAG: 4-(cytidine 5'-diphospho)-2-C-methyl-D-erythritol kinase [Kordiimonadales bacterium]|nr:MAG: 4-(cytidine 5'-diphospho)-2-C-methyl-D-erythritol kinase [Kordiimonadales bacterium]
MVISKTAPAKINLFLHVVGRREDGYHLLESLFVFTETGDVITVSPHENLTLTLAGPYAAALGAVCPEAEQNIVLKAAVLLQREANLFQGAAITLEKNLPIASGIGGGSADAAATLLALNELWQLGFGIEKLAVIGLQLGADVPACLYQSPLMVSGIGEHFEPVKLPGPYSVLLVNPHKELSTPSVFGAFHASKDECFLPSAPLPAFRDPLDFNTWVREESQNVLEGPAISLCPEIIDVLGALKSHEGVELVRMSGSGATCFALFSDPHAAGKAHRALQQSNPHWWLKLDKLVAG